MQDLLALLAPARVPNYRRLLVGNGLWWQAVVNGTRYTVSSGWIFAAGSFAMAVSVLSFAASTHFSLSLGLLVLAGVGQACFSVMQSAIVLTTARDDMRDRAMGTVAMAIGAGPPGRLQVGVLAQSFGARLAVGLTTAVAAVTVAAVTAALPGFRRGGGAGAPAAPGQAGR
ncbi:MAG: hypothetical protein AB1505_15970 [Candidatus Latescibacterota bacterium]